MWQTTSIFVRLNYDQNNKLILAFLISNKSYIKYISLQIIILTFKKIYSAEVSNIIVLEIATK